MYQLLILILLVVGFQSQEINKTTVNNSCFPNSWGLAESFIIGLSSNMSAVPGTSRICFSQTECLKYLFIINDMPYVAWVTFRINRELFYKIDRATIGDSCFPNSWGLAESFIIGLSSNMSAVPGTSRSCFSQTECLNYLFIVNDYSGVAWVTFRINR
jgi:undecaprenyl pyrophosphate phosphatase UppP